MYAAFGVVLLLLENARCGVLMWGSQSLQIPSLKQFNSEDFDLLRAYLRNPKIIAFQGDPADISTKLQDLLRNKYTAYTPNCNVDIEDVIELDGDAEDNYKTIQDKLEESDGENVLAMIISSKNRSKRDAGDVEATTEYVEPTETVPSETADSNNPYEPPTGPVLYAASDKEESNGYAMLYSSQPLILRSNTSNLVLGEAKMTTLDSRAATRLSASIMTAEGKITLRFKFPWTGRGYWSLTSVDLIYIDNKPYTLTATEEIQASRNFSYHCTGQSVFVDRENDIELKVFDLQAQPDSRTRRFNDAYDCVGFTTGPIWSGLFVTSILMVVLAIGLGALNSIKTMDKFDNSKTKQLSITTSE